MGDFLKEYVINHRNVDFFVKEFDVEFILHNLAYFSNLTNNGIVP